MSVSIRPALFGVAILAGAVALAVAAPGSAQAPVNAGAGAYTAAQAEMGGKAYADNCSNCHGADLGGGPGTPSLKGPEFMFGWTGKSAGDLFTFIHDKMPPGQAGALSDQQYTEIVAAILGANEFPAGAKALPSGAAGVMISK